MFLKILSKYSTVSLCYFFKRSTNVTFCVDELNARFRRRKEKEQREDKERENAENKSRLQAVKEMEDERRRIESDPFFSMYRQPDDEEEQLAQAMSESLAIAGHHHDDEDDGPRTVWGTRMVANPEEEHYMDHHDWADHIVITKSKRKGRSKKR